jgi:high-affinity iron transporter
LTLSFYLLSGATAQAEVQTVQDQTKQIWQLLDYIAVDYGKAVKDGLTISDNEYKEMQEFADTAELQLQELPATAVTHDLLKKSCNLESRDCLQGTFFGCQ